MNKRQHYAGKTRTATTDESIGARIGIERRTEIVCKETNTYLRYGFVPQGHIQWARQDDRCWPRRASLFHRSFEREREGWIDRQCQKEVSQDSLKEETPIDAHVNSRSKVSRSRRRSRSRHRFRNMKSDRRLVERNFGSMRSIILSKGGPFLTMQSNPMPCIDMT